MGASLLALAKSIYHRVENNGQQVAGHNDRPNVF